MKKPSRTSVAAAGLPDSVTIGADGAATGPDGKVLFRIPWRRSSTGDSFGVGNIWIKDWDPARVAAQVLAAYNSAAYWILRQDGVEGGEAKARMAIDGSQLLRELRLGEPVPPAVQQVAEFLRERFVATEHFGVTTRVAHVKELLRQLGGKITEEELLTAWREVAAEEVLSS